MSIEYKNVTHENLADALFVEQSFFGGNLSKSPFALREDFELILESRGGIIVQYVDGRPNGLVALIKVKDLLESNYTQLPVISPLKKVCETGYLTNYPDHFCVYTWAGLDSHAAWLFRHIANSPKYEKLIGTCDQADTLALERYLRATKSVGRIADLYQPGTVHSILVFEK